MGKIRNSWKFEKKMELLLSWAGWKSWQGWQGQGPVLENWLRQGTFFFPACVAMFVAARIVCLERGHSMTMNHSVVLLPITSAKNNNTDCLTLLSKGDHKKHSPKQWVINPQDGQWTAWEEKTNNPYPLQTLYCCVSEKVGCISYITSSLEQIKVNNFKY